MLAVHPKANIIERRLDSYPIRVQIYAGEDDEIIFSVDQRNLFSKYAAKRIESIELIKKAVSEH